MKGERVIKIIYKGRVPIYFQIVQQFKYLIASGSLKPGDKLPSVRTLAKEISVDIGTIKRAYRQLRKEGFTCIRYGIGTYVIEPEVQYSDEERKQILTEHIKVLLTAMEHLNFSLPEFIELIHECADSMNTDKKIAENCNELCQESDSAPTEQSPEPVTESICCEQTTPQEISPTPAEQGSEPACPCPDCEQPTQMNY